MDLSVDWDERAAKKKAIKLIVFESYRKPTQVDKRKYAKVNGWDLVKELGKKVAVSSQYGLPPQDGCNKRFSSDCLSKTQLRANS